MSNDLLARPSFGDGDSAAIAAHVVVLSRHHRRIVAELVAPSISNVFINGVAVAVKFPDSWHRHGSPALVVEVDAIEVGWTHIAVLHPVEFPNAVERQEVLGFLADSGFGFLCIFVGEIVGVHWQPVHLVEFGVLPFLESLSACAQ